MADRNRPDRRSSRLVESGIRALADNMGEGLAVIQQGRIVYMNDKLAEVSGMTREELIDQDLNTLFPDDIEPRRYIDVRARRERGEKIDYPSEIRFRLDSGRIIEMRNRSSLIEWSGKPATVHFLENITRRKEIERLLLEQKEVNSILTETVSRILASPLSLDETAGMVLDSAMGLTGSRSGILIIEDENGQRVLQRRCTGKCEICALPSALESILEDEGLMDRSRPGRISGAFYLNMEIETGKNCSETQFFRNILRVPARNDGPLSGQIILVDKEESFGPWDLDNMEKVAEVLNLALVRLRADEELQNARILAEKEAEARGLFLANVSHEIRSPLNGVLMMASLLQDSGLTGDQKELLGIIMFSARTIDRLIRDLTDLTQIRSGKFTVYADDFNLGELCRHIMETNRPEAMRKGLLLDYSVASEASHYYGDRERVGQIISNLVTNAIKYTKRGHVLLDISLDISEGDAELRIEVSDTGLGIPEDQQEAVFGLFRQVHSEDTGGKSEGSGIGLAVVKELTEAMMGRIHLESRKGEGSCFTVFLPINAAESMVSARIQPPHDSVPGDIVRILVAEDEGINRLYLRTLLEREGWSIDEAYDGMEAVASARSKSYDLILMDINMPRMDGLEASAQIRGFLPNVPIVAITAHAHEEDRHRILGAGLDDIVLKPFEEDVLMSCVKRYLRTI